MKKVDTINIVQFKTDLETSIEKIRSDYGSWRVLEFDVPEEITAVCFLEYDVPIKIDISSSLCLQEQPDFDYLICNAWTDYEAQVDDGSSMAEFPNVYAKPSSAIESDINIGRIETTTGDYYLCVEAVAGKIKIKATGLGDGTRIEAWQ